MKKEFIAQIIKGAINNENFIDRLVNLLAQYDNDEKLEYLCGLRTLVTEENVKNVWKDLEPKFKEQCPYEKVVEVKPSGLFEVEVKCLMMTESAYTGLSIPRDLIPEASSYINSHLDISSINSKSDYDKQFKAITSSDEFFDLLAKSSNPERSTSYLPIYAILSKTIEA